MQIRKNTTIDAMSKESQMINNNPQKVTSLIVV